MTTLTLTKIDDNIVALSFPYDPKLVEEVRGIPGRRWHKESKCWTAPITSASEMLSLVERMPVGKVAWADPETEQRLRAFASTSKVAIAASRATDMTDIVIPVPAGLEYLGYQRAGIGYALAHINTLIADEMGLGKTIQAIGVMNAEPSKARRIVVVCPASLKLNWQRELHKWLVLTHRIIVVSGARLTRYTKWDVLFSSFGHRREHEIVVINYDIIKNYLPLLRDAELDMLVLDEAHYCKSPKAMRTQLIYGQSKYGERPEVKPIDAKRILALTGTPILNKPEEIWTTIHRLAPREFSSKSQFTWRYCYGYGAEKNLGEMQDRLRAACMVRRLKKEVLKDLPPKRRQVIEFECDLTQEGAVAEEVRAYAKSLEKLQKLRLAVELAKASEDEKVYHAAVAALRDGVGVAFTEMSKLRHATAVAKIPIVVAHLQECIEAGIKVVCHAWHRDVVDTIVKAFPEGAVNMHGDTSMGDRQLAVDRFQTDEKVRLIVGNMKVMGVGWTLTASSHVVFAELDWVPGNITQAEDRVHRIGQDESVLVQHLVLEGSLDATMAKRLVDKQKMIDEALDNEKAVIAREPILGLREEEKPASHDETRESIAKVAHTLSTQCIDAIHQGLRMLAGTCDGASARDDMGFNKLDTAIGHSLASCMALTPRQAVLGQKLVRKYRRQLPHEILEAADALPKEKTK